MTAHLHPCPAPGCGALTRESHCPDHKGEQHRHRPSSRKARAKGGRGYDRRHVRLRALMLQRYPLCHWPTGVDRCIAYATVLDHIVPVDVAPELQYRTSNLQTLCATHHAVKTAEEQDGRYYSVEAKRLVRYP